MREVAVSSSRGGGGGIAINELFRVCATVKGMVFKQFNLG